MILAQSELKPFLSPKQFREATGNMIGTNNLYGMLEAKVIRSVKIGRKYLIPASEVQDFPRRVAEGKVSEHV